MATGAIRTACRWRRGHRGLSLSSQRLRFPPCPRRRTAILHIHRQFEPYHQRAERQSRVEPQSSRHQQQRARGTAFRRNRIANQRIQTAYRRLAETLRRGFQEIRAAETAKTPAARAIANHPAERHAGRGTDESCAATQTRRKPRYHHFRDRHRQDVPVRIRCSPSQTKSHAVHRAAGADSPQSRGIVPKSARLPGQ